MELSVGLAQASYCCWEASAVEVKPMLGTCGIAPTLNVGMGVKLQCSPGNRLT